MTRTASGPGDDTRAPRNNIPPTCNQTTAPHRHNGGLHVSPAEQRYELAVELAFELGRQYERAAIVELARLTDTWHTDLTWDGQVALRSARYGPGRSLVLDDPLWPPVTIPGGGA